MSLLPTSFAVVSWSQDREALVFWSGQAWTSSVFAEYHGTRGGAREAMAGAPLPPYGFGDPEILDVQAFNQAFGRSIGPVAAAHGLGRD